MLHYVKFVIHKYENRTQSDNLFWANELKSEFSISSQNIERSRSHKFNGAVFNSKHVWTKHRILDMSDSLNKFIHKGYKYEVISNTLKLVFTKKYIKLLIPLLNKKINWFIIWYFAQHQCLEFDVVTLNSVKEQINWTCYDRFMNFNSYCTDNVGDLVNLFTHWASIHKNASIHQLNYLLFVFVACSLGCLTMDCV